MVKNCKMSEETKRAMAERLSFLMRKTPSLDTLQKVRKRSGVSYGTVRRIRNAEPTDVSIGNVEAIAAVFNLSLVDFIKPFDERLALSGLRSISPEDASDILRQVVKTVQLIKAANRANLLQAPASDQSQSS